jgi:hypothetical protein
MQGAGKKPLEIEELQRRAKEACDKSREAIARAKETRLEIQQTIAAIKKRTQRLRAVTIQSLVVAFGPTGALLTYML